MELNNILDLDFWGIVILLKSTCSKGTEELGSDIAAPEADYADRQDVEAAFGILNEEERMIVSFSVFGGYKSQEIARILQIKAATVRSKKARALEKMRQVLK